MLNENYALLKIWLQRKGDLNYFEANKTRKPIGLYVKLVVCIVG